VLHREGWLDDAVLQLVKLPPNVRGPTAALVISEACPACGSKQYKKEEGTVQPGHAEQDRLVSGLKDCPGREAFLRRVGDGKDFASWSYGAERQMKSCGWRRAHFEA
jgi:hypothetical protein